MSGIWRCGCGELILHGYSQCWSCGTVRSEEVRSEEVRSEEGRLEEGRLVSPEETIGEVSRASPETAELSPPGKASPAPVRPKAIRWFGAEIGAMALLHLGLPTSVELFASGLW